MKVYSSHQQDFSPKADGNGRQDNELNRQKWLREMDKAHTEMVKDMRAVTAPDVLTTNRENGVVKAAVFSGEASDRKLGDGARNFSAAVEGDISTTLPSNVAAQIAMPGGADVPAGTTDSKTVVKPIIDLASIFSEARGKIDEEIATTAGNRASFSQVDWSTQNVHIESTDNGVVIWVRNTELAPGDEVRMAAQLRRSLSGLGARLNEIYLNGHLVDSVGL